MTDSIDTLRDRIARELDVLADDVQETHDGNGLTFHLPSGDLEKAQEILDGEIEVLETWENEDLVRIRP